MCGLLEEISNITAKYATAKELRQPPFMHHANRSSRTSIPSVALGSETTLPLIQLRQSTSLVASSVRQKNTATTLRLSTPYRLRFTFSTKPWGISDKDALEDKTDKLCYWNDRLEGFIRNPIRASLGNHGLAANLLNTEDMHTFDQIIEVSKHENEGVRSLAKLWKEKSNFESRDPRQSNPGQYRGDLSALTTMVSLPTSKCGLSLQLFRESNGRE